MRKEKQLLTTKKFFFSAWTRKPWAVFRSLNIVVHNKLTNIHSFKDTLLRQSGANRNEIIQFIRNLDNSTKDSEEDRVRWLDIFLYILQSFFFIKLVGNKIIAAQLQYEWRNKSYLLLYR